MSKFGKSDKPETHNKRLKTSIRDEGKEKEYDENSAVLRSFKEYATQLDKKHDLYERLVKLSRDITIESKRIIFLLHSINRGREEQQVILEAKKRLDNLVQNYIYQIGKELQFEDPYLFHRAFTFGLQEFIEAYTFYHQLKDKKLNHWDLYQELLKYNLKSERTENNAEGKSVSTEVITLLPPVDYILGIADLSGELMRKCINSLGAGDMKGCFETCEVVRNLYAGFLSIGSNKTKEITEKVHTLRQNLLKMEKVCYNISVRSKELPEHILIHLVSDLEGPEKEY